MNCKTEECLFLCVYMGILSNLYELVHIVVVFIMCNCRMYIHGEIIKENMEKILCDAVGERAFERCNFPRTQNCHLLYYIERDRQREKDIVFVIYKGLRLMFVSQK